MEIKHILTNHIMIFKNDELNLASLKRNESLNLLNAQYGLKLIQYPDNLGIQIQNLIFKSGEFSYEDEIYLINEITIDSRKIIIKFNGPSDVSEVFFEKFKDDLLKLDIRKVKPSLEPIITTFETQCVTKLKMNMKGLFAGSKMESFFNSTEKLLPKFEAEHFFIPFSFKFKIGFLNLPEHIIKNKLSLSEKFVIIEHREQTDPEDCIFFTSTPSDYKTHIEILKQLEELF